MSSPYLGIGIGNPFVVRSLTKKITLHRVIEWVDFSPIFESPAAFVVVAVGMWATRLRCPSCAQRCLSYGHDLIEGGAALLIAISMTDEGPMEFLRRNYSAGSMQVRILSRRYSSLRNP